MTKLVSERGVATPKFKNAYVGMRVFDTRLGLGVIVLKGSNFFHVVFDNHTQPHKQLSHPSYTDKEVQYNSYGSPFEYNDTYESFVTLI